MTDQAMVRVKSALDRFVTWLDSYGETSWDHQSYYAGPWGRRAKGLYYKKPVLGLIAVAPMVFSEAFAPWARRLFWHRQRLPISDAHYAMGFALLKNLSGEEKFYEKAVHFLEILKQTRCPGYDHFSWGYPFDWQTRGGIIPAGTPLITTTPYAYEAFSAVFEIDADPQWQDIMRSVAEHAAYDLGDFDSGPNAKMCSYTPSDDGGVINASAYRAALLTDASIRFKEEKFWDIAEKNINFVLQNQQANGSWLYAIDSDRDFVDHFHTCFVLKALIKVEKLTGNDGCRKAIERGIEYYLENLFDENGLPKPFSRAPRLTVYKNELYDYAESVNLGVLLKGRFPELDEVIEHVVNDVLTRWLKPDGSFRSRRIMLGWDNVPMHRWAQSQMFRSLCLWLLEQRKVKTGS